MRTRQTEEGDLEELAGHLRRFPLTLTELAEAMGLKVAVLDRLIRRYRIVHAGEALNIVGQCPGLHEPWLYELTDTQKSSGQWWAAYRLRDLKTRLAVTTAVAKSIEAATEAQSAEGLKARKVVRVLEFLGQEMAEIPSARKVAAALT